MPARIFWPEKNSTKRNYTVAKKQTENVITNVHNEKTKHIDLGRKVKETNKDIQIGERISINLMSTQM